MLFMYLFTVFVKGSWHVHLHSYQNPVLWCHTHPPTLPYCTSCTRGVLPWNYCALSPIKIHSTVAKTLKKAWCDIENTLPTTFHLFNQSRKILLLAKQKWHFSDRHIPLCCQHSLLGWTVSRQASEICHYQSDSAAVCRLQLQSGTELDLCVFGQYWSSHQALDNFKTNKKKNSNNKKRKELMLT